MKICKRLLRYSLNLFLHEWNQLDLNPTIYMCTVLCLRVIQFIICVLLLCISALLKFFHGIRAWLGLIPHENTQEDVITIEADSLYIGVCEDFSCVKFKFLCEWFCFFCWVAVHKAVVVERRTRLSKREKPVRDAELFCGCCKREDACWRVFLCYECVERFVVLNRGEYHCQKSMRGGSLEFKSNANFWKSGPVTSIKESLKSMQGSEDLSCFPFSWSLNIIGKL